MAEDEVQDAAATAVSRTEPSTPLRNVVRADPLAANYSLPTFRDYGQRFRLPPPEIPSISDILQQERKARDLSHPVNRSRSRSHSRSRPRTPNRRASDFHESSRRESEYRETVTSRRRRRSSMLTTQSGQIVYDSTYVGPVTIDYLRFLCKVQIDETIARERPPTPDIKENHIAKISQTQSPVSATDFDHSLPLPSDNFLKSPEQLRDILEPSAFEVAVNLLTEAVQVPQPAPPERTKSLKVFMSYLERILEAQKNRSIDKNASDSIPKNDTISSASPETIKLPLNDRTGLVIENRLVGTPAFDNLNLTNRTSVGFSDTNTGTLSRPSTEHNRLHQQFIIDTNDILASIDRSASTALNVTEYTPNDGYEIRNDDQDVDAAPDFPNSPTNKFDKDFGAETAGTGEVETPSWNGHQYSPSDIVTPPQEPTLYPGDIASTSPKGVVHEQYVMNDDNYNSDLQTGLLDDPINGDISHLIDEPVEEGTLVNSRRVVRSASSKKPAQLADIPLNKIRHLVKHIQHTSTTHGLNSPPRKKKRINRLAPATYSHIQKLSGDFLLSLGGDLEAYATHRGSSQILLKDVVLYLDRIRTAEKESTKLEVISNLAQDFFPLEHLISLENSLLQAMNGNSGKTQDTDYTSSESDLEHNNEGVKSMGNFSDSDTSTETEY